MSIRKLPTFLGIGAQRAGTTWLFTHLRNHPEIWMPPVKELHFFDRKPKYPSPNFLAIESPLARFRGSLACRQHMRTGIQTFLRLVRQGRLHDARWWWLWTFGTYDKQWYVRLFTKGKDFPAVGEITPSYAILDRRDLAEVHAVNPDMKFIFMIRNPVERAWSALRFYKLNGGAFDITSDEEVIALLQTETVVQRSDYERTINLFVDYFGPNRLLLCFYDAILHDPAGLLDDIAGFLGVTSMGKKMSHLATQVNRSPDYSMSEKVAAHLSGYYGPDIEKLAARFGSYAGTWKDSLSAGRQEICPETDMNATLLI